MRALSPLQLRCPDVALDPSVGVMAGLRWPLAVSLSSMANTLTRVVFSKLQSHDCMRWKENSEDEVEVVRKEPEAQMAARGVTSCSGVRRSTPGHHS